jgi:hypothetical protein
MVKYYWYIISDPKSETYDMDEEDIKRSITVPTEDLFYIMETIDGYKHTIIEKNSGKPPIIVNDMGKPNEISRIDRKIKMRLIEKWNEDRRKYLSDKRNIDDNEDIHNLDMYALMQSRNMGLYRKKKTTRIVKRCKCPTKRIIRKVRK